MGFLIGNDIFVKRLPSSRPLRTFMTNHDLFEDSLTNTYDEGFIRDAVLYDIVKVFDRFTHIPIFAKLKPMGICMCMRKPILRKNTIHLEVLSENLYLL